eukprot:CAMPEP_0113938448 /NCGR_PEP_ID=MMETSP1339-20121228/4880_1 /TAXON_ID=94617 /ORGANISM="Fibrocapsa japonica" /LENGTH=70 /DNA_ID=CAMNT_0000941571 /DNA_START=141 /DNA_END=353 /DNA_ORIENTATION=- /assembly_acc=CAM_ASM_000762
MDFNLSFKSHTLLSISLVATATCLSSLLDIQLWCTALGSWPGPTGSVTTGPDLVSVLPAAAPPPPPSPTE